MFNITKVNKELRSSDFLSWYREEDADYICNGYFIIKTDLTKEENRKILGLLVEKFGTIPEKNKGLEFKRNEFIQTAPDWFKFIEKRPTKAIEDTCLVEIDNDGEKRIFKGEDYIYINMKYFEMIDKNLPVKYEGGKNLEPISAVYEDDLLLIMPIKMPENNKFLVKKEKDLSSCN
ncbi:hypothetical protein [Tissierella praeacuta]|uniref:hypothetical protein n=3 Tax=Tissierella praeacuta TaxID=43131 RepID=UPI002FD8BA83